jgi:arylsulfatase A-like enzyme
MMPKSILLVTVDCLRADHVGFMGYARPTSPFLDTLATESFVFPAAIVAGAPTYYSLPSILASRSPLALGRDVIGLAPSEATLPRTLKQAGYATAAFNAGNPYISARFGYEQSFDQFCDFLQGETTPVPDEAEKLSGNGWASRLNRRLQQSSSALGPLRLIYDELYFQYCQRVSPAPGTLDALRRFPAADVIVDHACSWLASIGSAPFFLWLHFMDPHAPYYPKPEAVSLMGDAPITPYDARYLNSSWNRSDLGAGRLARHRDRVLALYDAGIRWVDMQLARLTEWLRNANRWHECVVALTADHGEEFLEHEGRYHAPAKLTEELIHVPLLLRVPGAAKKQIPHAPFSLLDLAPTLLQTVGLAIPSAFRGLNRWSQIQQGISSDDAAITECVACTNPFRQETRMGPRALSVREKRFKLVLDFNSAHDHLYDLEADPGEHAPLNLETQKTVRRRLLELAREHLLTSSHSDSEKRLRTRLRDLRLEWERSYPRRAAI